MKHKVEKIHFVGIGGAGMSGIAEVLVNEGYRVTGSDLGTGSAVQRLSALGVTVHQGHDAAQIGDADVVVVSTAIKSDNPEVLAARSRRIPIVPRAMMLAELMRKKVGIAVAGTHGKTTTTSLVAAILAAEGLDPTFVIGGVVNSVGANAALGKGEYIVVEADESDASFLTLLPMIEVITNIDADHMETYDHDLTKLKQAFISFTNRMPFYGSVVACIDDGNTREILPFISRQVLSYGVHPDARVRASGIQAEGSAMTFIVHRENEEDLPVRLNLPGHHNVLNALAAIGVATELGISNRGILQGLSGFKGVGRRFQSYGDHPSSDGGCFTLIDDYGHHPVEMKATLAATRGAFPGRRLVLVFQPHRYTRTRDLFEDFVQVLASVDVLILGDVYAAGEAPIAAADGRALSRAIRVLGKVEPVFVERIEDVPSMVLPLLRHQDVVVTMGAGSVGQVPAKLAALAAQTQPMERDRNGD